MIIQRIFQNGNEKLLAIAKRYKDGTTTESELCDWNTEPNFLRIYDSSGVKSRIKFASFKDCVKYIFSL